MTESLMFVAIGMIAVAATLNVIAGVAFAKISRLWPAIKNMAEWTRLASGIAPPPTGLPALCPHCQAHETLYPGPRGGAAINLICIECGTKYNFFIPLGTYEEVGRDKKLAGQISRVVKLRFSP